MDGYLGDDQGFQPVDKAERRGWWKQVAFAVAYMIPLFILWSYDDFPDGLGVHVEAHGKVGVIEDWYYSYLLIERHEALDLLTFAYMWAPVIGFVGWLAFKRLRNLNLSLYSNETE